MSLRISFLLLIRFGDNYLDAAVHLAAFGRVVSSDRAHLAKSASAKDAVFGNAGLNDEVTNALRAVLR